MENKLEVPMFRCLILACIGLSFCTQAFTQQRIISHVTRAGGGFATEVIIENNAVLDQTITLSPFDEAGNALTAIDIDIAALGVTKTDSTALFADGEAVSHFLINAPEDVLVKVSYNFAGGAGSPAQVPETTDQGSIWRIFPGDWSQIFDGIAVVNTGGSATDVWVAQKDFAGNVIQSTRAATALAPNAKGLFVIGSPADSVFTPTPETYFEISGDQKLAITALRGTLSGSSLGVLWSNDARRISESITNRDAQGIWFIEDGSLYNVFEMLGYNNGKDRLWQAVLFKRLSNGTLAEIFGPNFLNGDIIVRTTNYSDDELDQIIAEMDQENREIYDAFTAGINRRIAEVNSDTSQMPFEFLALNLNRVEPWTVRDVLNLLANTQRTFSAETLGFRQVENLELAAQLIDFADGDLFTASRMFDDLRWENDTNAPTMIPKPEVQKGVRAKSTPSDWSGANLEILPTVRRETAMMREAFDRRRDLLKEYGIELKMGSYAWVVNGEKTQSGNPILYAGPQVGFDAPSPVLEVSINTDGLQVSGMSIAGLPAIVVGRTPNHAWSFQVGHAHIWDFYFEDQADVFVDRIETFRVAGAATQEIPVLASNRGPIVNQALVLSWKYAMKGYEFDIAGGILGLARAQNIDEFHEAVGKLGVSQHILYADKEGNIGYWMSGRVPVREEGNYRFPQGFLPPLEWDTEVIKPIVHDRNPAQGWYGGWNNRASIDTPDLTATQAFSSFHRAHIIQDFLANNDNLTFEELADFAKTVASTFNSNQGGNEWEPIRETLTQIVRDNPTPERLEALELMESWNGLMPLGGLENFLTTTDVEDAWQFYRQWLILIIDSIFDDEAGTINTFFQFANRYGTILHMIDPETAFVNFWDWVSTPDPEAPQTFEDHVLTTLDTSLALLGERPWGTGLRDVNEYDHALLGLVFSTPFLNKATYAQCVELDETGPIRIESFFPLGQSGTLLLDSATGQPVTEGGTPLPLIGPPPEDDPYFSMVPFYETFTLRPFPLFEQR
jgi:penicillin amidase